MTPAELLLVSQYDDAPDDAPNFRREVAIKATNDERQIVYGEVYIPDTLDTHGEMMLAEDVELMAHRFLATLKNAQIDVQHDNEVIKAVAVESFIARADDPLWHEGAWVLGLHIEDTQKWSDVKTGKLNGFSVEAWISKQDAVIELSYLRQVFGLTQKADGHDHVFFIQMDDEGNVVGGYTSEEDKHSHVINFATATEISSAHAHRIALP